MIQDPNSSYVAPESLVGAVDNSAARAQLSSLPAIEDTVPPKRIGEYQPIGKKDWYEIYPEGSVPKGAQKAWWFEENGSYVPEGGNRHVGTRVRWWWIPAQGDTPGYYVVEQINK